MQKPILDVVVPCFMQGYWLEPLLNAIALAANCRHQVVIVDDASPDRLTHLALSSLRPASNLQALEILRLPVNSGGAAHPRNAGFLAGTSEYVLFLDSDDLLVERSLCKSLTEMSEKNHDVSIGNWVTIGNSSVSASPMMTPRIPYSLSTSWVFRYWERGLTIPIHSAIFRRSSFKPGIAPFSEVYQTKEDFYFWATYFDQKRNVLRNDTVQAVYRTSGESMSQSNFFKNGIAFCEVAIDLAEKYPYLECELQDNIEYARDFYGTRVRESDRNWFSLEIDRMLCGRTK